MRVKAGKVKKDGMSDGMGRIRNQKPPSRSVDLFDVHVRRGRRGEGVGGDLL